MPRLCSRSTRSRRSRAGSQVSSTAARSGLLRERTGRGHERRRRRPRLLREGVERLGPHVGDQLELRLQLVQRAQQVARVDLRAAHLAGDEVEQVDAEPLQPAGVSVRRRSPPACAGSARPRAPGIALGAARPPPSRRRAACSSWSSRATSWARILDLVREPRDREREVEQQREHEREADHEQRVRGRRDPDPARQLLEQPGPRREHEQHDGAQQPQQRVALHQPPAPDQLEHEQQEHAVTTIAMPWMRLSMS